MTTLLRLFYAFSFILFLVPLTTSAQLSVAALELEYGNYAVGYRYDMLYDKTRAYQTEGDWDTALTARPLPLSIWYPAVAGHSEDGFLSVMDYLRVLRDEGEWGTLPDSLILGWFSYADTAENRRVSKGKTRAARNLQVAEGSFPVVIYAPGFMGSSTENFVLCELLASRGYIVVAAPGRGASSISMRGTALRNAEGQARDLEHLLAYAKSLPSVQPDKVALMDYSFGGLATVLVGMRNPTVNAIVSLDGRSRYDPETLFAAPSVDLNGFRIPFLHLAQKTIPEEVLKADGIPVELNTEFTLFDTLENSHRYAFRLHDLSHRHFSGFGLLLGTADPRQDKSDAEVVPAYRLLTRFVISFLDAELQGDIAARAILKGDPAVYGYLERRVSLRSEKPNPSLNFREFHGQVRNQGYENLNVLYRNAQQAYPDFVVPEWKLNDLGLRLGFKRETYLKGVAIYRFALSLYPNSANLWDSLGLIQQVNGDYAAAAKSYRKSLALNPDNGHAKMRLEQVE